MVVNSTDRDVSRLTALAIILGTFIMVLDPVFGGLAVSPCGALIRLPAWHYPLSPGTSWVGGFRGDCMGRCSPLSFLTSPLNQGRVRLDDSNTIESNSSVSTPPGGTLS